MCAFACLFTLTLKIEILVVDEIWRPEEVKELQLAKLKRVQILAGNPCPTLQLARDQVRFPYVLSVLPTLTLFVKNPDLVKCFDFVVELVSPVEYLLYNLVSQTVQRRLRTVEGVFLEEPKPISVV